MNLESLQDEALIDGAREQPDRAREYLEVLYSRYHRRVAAWCLRICGSREEAADLAQDVFLRVQSRLDTFRMDSCFSTWLYAVTRSVGINRGVSKSRRKSRFLSLEKPPEQPDPAPEPAEVIERDETLRKFRKLIRQNLDPEETRVLFLHYAHGVPLATVTQMLGLTNKSGAKAIVVRAKRKLRGKFGDLGAMANS